MRRAILKTLKLVLTPTRGLGGAVEDRRKCEQEQGSLCSVTVGRGSRKLCPGGEGRKGCESSHGANEEVAGDIGRTQGLSRHTCRNGRG